MPHSCSYIASHGYSGKQLIDLFYERKVKIRPVTENSIKPRPNMSRDIRKSYFLMCKIKGKNALFIYRIANHNFAREIAQILTFLNHSFQCISNTLLTVYSPACVQFGWTPGSFYFTSLVFDLRTHLF